MFDLFVVAYENDYPLLKIFANSIGKFCQNLPITNIHIVNNCDAQLLVLNFGMFNDRIKFYNYKDLYNGRLIDGYVRQQVLKLSAHQVCTAENIIILDSKNFFIRNITSADFVIDNKFHACYSHTITQDTLPEYPIKKYAFDLFSVSVDTPTMSINTPFLIKKQTLEELESVLVQNFNLALDNFFGNFVPASTNEFYLMQAYIISKYGSLEEYYYFTNPFSTGLWDSNLHFLDDSMTLKDFLNVTYTNKFDIMVSAIHYRSIKEMNDSVKQQLINYWTELDIISRDEASQIINDIVNE